MQAATIARLVLDPAQLMTEIRLTPDPWQARALRSEAKRLLICASRQSGKSTVVSLIALAAALFQDRSLGLIVSKTERQSLELFRKVIDSYHALGDPVPATRELTFTLELANGSRIVALPGDPSTIRGFSGPSLICIDEAALVDDALFAAVLPMLAVSGGRLVAFSTPFGRRGTFATQWSNGDPTWERISAKAAECPRITAEFLEEQRRLLSERDYSQEFECEFNDTIGAVFRRVTESVDKGRTHAIEEANRRTGERWGNHRNGRQSSNFFAGCDLARVTDFTAISVLDSAGRQVYLARFNQISWQRQIALVAKVAEEFGCDIVLDTTGVGDPVHEALRDMNVPIYPYHFTHQSKTELIEGLAMSLEQGKLRLLDDPIQTAELLAYEYSQTPTGKVTTGAPPGGHDDTVIALGLANFSFGGGGYYSAGCL